VEDGALELAQDVGAVGRGRGRSCAARACDQSGPRGGLLGRLGRKKSRSPTLRRWGVGDVVVVVVRLGGTRSGSVGSARAVDGAGEGGALLEDEGPK